MDKSFKKLCCKGEERSKRASGEGYEGPPKYPEIEYTEEEDKEECAKEQEYWGKRTLLRGSSLRSKNIRWLWKHGIHR